MAEGIRVPNRAQALSFSLANVALVRSATQLATEVAGRVGEAIGFDEILQRTPAAAGGVGGEPLPEIASTDAALQRRLTDTIRSHLAKRSITLNQPLELRVHQDGSLRVDTDHPQGGRNRGFAQFRRQCGAIGRRTGPSDRIKPDFNRLDEFGRAREYGRARRVSELVRRLIRNQLPRKGLRVRVPCPPLPQANGSQP